jgi:hypothetical protein
LFGNSPSVNIDVTEDIENLEISFPSLIVGRVVTADGSPFPAVPLTTGLQVDHPGGIVRGGSIGVQPGGAFTLLSLGSGDYRVSVGGLPPGYSLKSVRVGDKDYGLGLVRIDYPIQGDLVLTLGVVPLSELKSVPVRGGFVNVPDEWSGLNRPLQLMLSARTDQP